MKRLGFALALAVVLSAAASLAAKAANPFEQKLSKDKQVVHALNRLTFGARPGDVERIRRLGVERWIRQQLQPHLLPESAALEARLKPLETLQLGTAQIFEKYNPIQTVALVQRPPLTQFVGPDEIRMLQSGTMEQRLSVIASIGAEELKLFLSALTPQMLQGLPELAKQAASARQADAAARQAVIRVLAPSLNQVLTAEQRRIAQSGTVDERRALLMSFDDEKRRQVLRALPPQAVNGLPELRREALAARQPAQLVNQDLIDAKLYRALYSERQLEEVLVDFWLNHFNVFNGKGQIRLLLTSYERDAIRPHVLGRFRDLLTATARHPAMLFYLDNWQSQVAPPEAPGQASPLFRRRPGLNENYGRELMELHTLGVDGGYTQDDVIAVARAFTGWTIHEVNRFAEFQFNPVMHDRGEKIVLGRTLAAGGGEQDGLRVIEILSRHPSTARFISQKLARRFVADDPPQALVSRMAETFTRTDGDLQAVLDTMLTSREFLSEGAWQAKLKSPLELVLSAARALDADVTDAAALSQRIAELGQPLYGKQEPTGYVDRSEAWANSAGFLGRINFANALVAGQIDGVKIDPARLPRTPAAAAKQLLGLAPPRATVELLEKDLPGGEGSAQRLASVLLASPDFQQR